MKEFFIKIKKTTWNLILFIAIAVIFVIVDFITKQVVLHNMKEGEMITVIPNFAYIHYQVNDGMAFSFNFNVLGSVANQIIFIAISTIGFALILFIFLRSYKKVNKLVSLSLGLMLAGCFGNLIDRVFYSQAYLQKYDPNVSSRGVVDFIGLDFGSYSFARFNVADSCLVIGVIILVIYLIIEEVKDAKIRRLKEEENMPEGKVISKDEQLIKGEEESINTEVIKNDNDDTMDSKESKE